MKEPDKTPRKYGAPRWYESVLGAPFALLGAAALVVALIVLGKQLLIAAGIIN